MIGVNLCGALECAIAHQRHHTTRSTLNVVGRNSPLPVTVPVPVAVAGPVTERWRGVLVTLRGGDGWGE